MLKDVSLPLPRPIFSKLGVTRTRPSPTSTLPKPSPPQRVLRPTKPTTVLLVEQELTDTDTDADEDTDMEVDANKAFNLSHPFHQSRNPRLGHGNVFVEDSDDGGREAYEDEQDVMVENPNTELRHLLARLHASPSQQH
jgi:hypothetical protein